ncbi:MAG TPA: bifunctional hydroxymethylpyrimidine kinase/phosphomethylpyrimidine kinase [Dehalococcoidia bacterium]|nr:bifunctional hydroxymethylpyrimidine kinase/phosphomethylpyrimidine kinase [Dehalococcoidia bacterium]
MTRVPRCLAIAASDSSGGAGLEADLKAFAAAGCHGTVAVTAVTAQHTRGITRIDTLPAAAVQAQLDAVLGDIHIDAVKTGALMTAEIVQVVAATVRRLDVPVVVDPVLGATAGDTALLDAPGVEALRAHLLPLATVVTPNLHEAEVLSGRRGSKAALAEALVAIGARAVIVTGGHGTAVDHLFDGMQHIQIDVVRVDGASHGSGCTHAATIAALLAQGMPLVDAARAASCITAEAIRNGLHDLGTGEGPVDVLGLAARPAQAPGARRMRRTT